MSVAVPIPSIIIHHQEAIAQTSDKFRVYLNEAYKIAMPFPSQWRVSEVSEDDETPEDRYASIVQFLSPPESSLDKYYENVHLQVDNLPFANENLGVYLQDTINAYQSSLNFELIESNANSILADYPAYKLVYTYRETWEEEDTKEDEDIEDTEDDDDVDLKIMEIGAIVGNKGYYVRYGAEVAKYNTYLPIAEEMIGALYIEGSNSNTPTLRGGLGGGIIQELDQSGGQFGNGSGTDGQGGGFGGGSASPGLTATLLGGILGNRTAQCSEGSCTYENPSLGIKFDYPSTWEQKQGDDSSSSLVAYFLSPVENDNDRFRENFQIYAYNAENTQLDENVQSVIEYNTKNYEEYTPINSDPITLAGNPAHSLVYAYWDPDIGAIQSMEVITVKDNAGFDFVYSAEQSKYVKYLPIILEIFKSLEIDMSAGISVPDNQTIPSTP
jgi:hypothetical protein